MIACMQACLLSVQRRVDFPDPREAGLVCTVEAMMEVDDGVVLLHILVQSFHTVSMHERNTDFQ